MENTFQKTKMQQTEQSLWLNHDVKMWHTHQIKNDVCVTILVHIMWPSGIEMIYKF